MGIQLVLKVGALGMRVIRVVQQQAQKALSNGSDNSGLLQMIELTASPPIAVEMSM